MNPRANTLEAPAPVSTAQVEHVLVAGGTGGEGRPSVQAHDFRNAPLLSARDLQKLRSHQMEFANALASRLSVFLRLDFTLRLAGLQTLLHRKLAQEWAGPTFLTLFKAEPLSGVGILEITPRLGSTMVDRLMGGPGAPSDAAREFSEIEKAILEQAAQVVIAEWCGHWRGTKDFKPAILGHETNGRFVQVATPETAMLVVSLEVRIAANAERMQIAFPYSALEPLIRHLSQGSSAIPEVAASTAPKPAPKWNTCFDDVRIPVAAQWHWSELSARELLGLKIGDVLPVDPEAAGGAEVTVANLPRFTARPGVIGGKWAVELGRQLKD